MLTTAMIFYSIYRVPPSAVLRKRIKWPRKRISKCYENAWKKCTKTHRKSLQKRMDLKIEDNQILPLDISQLPYYVMYNVHPWGDQIRLPLTKQLWTDVHMQFRRLSLTNSAQNLYCFNLYSISVCMIRNQFDYLAECECLHSSDALCIGSLCIANICYLAGLYGNFEIYYFHV